MLNLIQVWRKSSCLKKIIGACIIGLVPTNAVGLSNGDQSPRHRPYISVRVPITLSHGARRAPGDHPVFGGPTVSRGYCTRSHGGHSVFGGPTQEEEDQETEQATVQAPCTRLPFIDPVPICEGADVSGRLAPPLFRQSGILFSTSARPSAVSVLSRDALRLAESVPDAYGRTFKG